MSVGPTQWETWNEGKRRLSEHWLILDSHWVADQTEDSKRKRAEKQDCLGLFRIEEIFWSVHQTSQFSSSCYEVDTGHCCSQGTSNLFASLGWFWQIVIVYRSATYVWRAPGSIGCRGSGISKIRILISMHRMTCLESHSSVQGVRRLGLAFSYGHCGQEATLHVFLGP